MKRLLISVSFVALLLAAGIATAAAIPAKSGSIVIRHQLRGCHTWSLNEGPFKVALDLRLARGGTLMIENIDPMVHQLVQKAGPRAGMRSVAHDHMKMMGLHRITGHGVMNHMGAALKVTFPQAGVYRFTTEDLGDYIELKTIGEHNHLMLMVRVS